MKLYTIMKTVHVVCDMIWIAGMLRLADPRAEAESTLEFDQNFTVPAMLGAWTAGLWLSAQSHWWLQPWWKIKFLLVLAMSGLHGVLVARLKRDGTSRRATSFVVILLLIGIVFLVLAKP